MLPTMMAVQLLMGLAATTPAPTPVISSGVIRIAGANHPSGALQNVPFEVGKASFDNGDWITVDTVRGTSPKMQVGGIYVVKGRYKLNSRERADLCLFITATDPANGTSPILPEQTTQVTRGEGQFTLVEHFICDGYPHVSFYPAGGGNDMGGIYFGQGERVLHGK